jgi:hypothetical protein
MSDLKSSTSRFPKVAEWLEQNGKEFYEAIGVWPGNEEMMVLVLSQIPTYIGGRFTIYKNATARERDHILWAFLKGESVAPEDLKSAIALLMQSFSGAVNRLASMEDGIRRRDRVATPRQRWRRPSLPH